tara:strand:+ start:30 stop:590 length:561 start_codon:yes stop_codon:yes gene_type:complete
MSRIIVDSVRNSSASSDGITLASDGSVTLPGNATCSGTATGFGGGKLLQVVTAETSAAASTASATSAEITSNLRCTIVPTAANSKIIIAASLYFSHNAHVIFTKIMKDGTTKVTGSDSPEDQSFYAGTAYMLRATIIVTETAGNTNSRYYTPFWSTDTATAYLNQYINATAIYDGTSSMTVMEVAA